MVYQIYYYQKKIVRNAFVEILHGVDHEYRIFTDMHHVDFDYDFRISCTGLSERCGGLDAPVAKARFARRPLHLSGGFRIPVTARFFNAGTNSQQDVEVGYTICSRSGALVHRDINAIHGSWGPLEFREVQFSGYTPSGQGTYYINLFTNLHNDEQRSNDTLFKMSRCGSPFEVRYMIEVSVHPPTIAGITPAENGTYPADQPIPIRVAVVNSGFTDATNVPVTVKIERGGCGPNMHPPVYFRSRVAATIPGSDSGAGPVTFVELEDKIANNPGYHSVVVWVHDPQDPFHHNDTLCWGFTVTPGPSSVHHMEDEGRVTMVDMKAGAESMLTVRPNPVHGTATIDVRLPSVHASMKLYDASGRLVKEEMIRSTRFELDASGLASGVYTIRMVTADGMGFSEKLVVAR